MADLYPGRTRDGLVNSRGYREERAPVSFTFLSLYFFLLSFFSFFFSLSFLASEKLQSGPRGVVAARWIHTETPINKFICASVFRLAPQRRRASELHSFRGRFSTHPWRGKKNSTSFRLFRPGQFEQEVWRRRAT